MSSETAEPEHTHYCEDCEIKLALLYDSREDEDGPLMCTHCGGTNCRTLTDEEKDDE